MCGVMIKFRSFILGTGLLFNYGRYSEFYNNVNKTLNINTVLQYPQQLMNYMVKGKELHSKPFEILAELGKIGKPFFFQ